MAGQKLVDHLTTFEDGLKDKDGVAIIGMPFTEIIENGNIQPGDEWALFRLTDDGLACYRMGAELAAGIMEMRIDGERAVQEVGLGLGRYKTKEEAREAGNKLPPEEKKRTLLRSVRPKKH